MKRADLIAALSEYDAVQTRVRSAAPAQEETCGGFKISWSFELKGKQPTAEMQLQDSRYRQPVVGLVPADVLARAATVQRLLEAWQDGDGDWPMAKEGA